MNYDRKEALRLQRELNKRILKDKKKFDPLTCSSDLSKDVEKRLIKSWKQHMGIQ